MNEFKKLIEWEPQKKFLLDSWPIISGFPTYSLSHLIRGRIFPEKDPYCFASFMIEIRLSPEFPFKLPTARIVDRMYHPNINDDGSHCCEWGFSSDSWCSTFSLVEFIEGVLKVINLDFDHNSNPEVTDEYQNQYEKFYEKALQYTLTYGRLR